MVGSKLGGECWRCCAEDVIATGAGAKQQQEPKGLEVVSGRDTLEQLFMAAVDVVQLVPHVCFRHKGRAEDCESLLLAGQGLVADPHIVA